MLAPESRSPSYKPLRVASGASHWSRHSVILKGGNVYLLLTPRLRQGVRPWLNLPESRASGCNRSKNNTVTRNLSIPEVLALPLSLARWAFRPASTTGRAITMANDAPKRSQGPQPKERANIIASKPMIKYHSGMRVSDQIELEDA